MIALWFGFINWVNKTKLSCYTPQQTQHHFFSGNVPPSLMIALALPQSLTFSAKLVPIRNHPTAFTHFIHDCFSFALVTHVLHHILIRKCNIFDWHLCLFCLVFKQEFFQYRIEADGNNRWGGIWEAPRDYTFLSTSDKQTKVKIVKKFDSWDENSNLGKRMPRLGLSRDLLLSSASTVNDSSGSLAYNSGASSASYLEPEKPKPNVVRYWMREGARWTSDFFLRPDSHLQIILISICLKLRLWPWYKRTLFFASHSMTRWNSNFQHYQGQI